jgi:hypothetical protein
LHIAWLSAWRKWWSGRRSSSRGCSGADNLKLKDGKAPIIIYKDELVAVGDRTFWELAGTKHRYHFNYMFGMHEYNVIIDDLKIKRRSATLKLSRENGSGLFQETTQLRAHSSHDRLQAKRCRDMLAAGQCGPTVDIKLCPLGDDSPAVTMSMMADLSLKNNLVIELSPENMTWLCAACLSIRKMEHTNTVVWNEVKHAFIVTRLQDTHMLTHATIHVMSTCMHDMHAWHMDCTITSMYTCMFDEDGKLVRKTFKARTEDEQEKELIRMEACEWASQLEKKDVAALQDRKNAEDRHQDGHPEASSSSGPQPA